MRKLMARPGSPSNLRSQAFTLIEILIVITIIALLAGLVLTSIGKVRQRANAAKAQSDIDRLNQAVKMFETDRGYLPGRKGSTEPDRNDMPLVLKALLPNKRRPKGYLDIKIDDVWTLAEDGKLKQVTKEEFNDENVDKYMLDPWMEPYIAREWASKKVKDDSARNQFGIDIMSKGPDRKEGTKDDLNN